MRKEVPVDKGEKQQNPVVFFVLFIAVLAVIAIIVHFLTGGMFLEARNAQVILSNSIYPTFIAWGFCFLFACGYADLSIGSVVILGSFAACAFGNMYGYPGVILGGLTVGALLVFINFMVFAFTKIPSWIASLSLMLIYEAIAIFLRANSVTRPYVDVELTREFRALGQFPLNVVLLVAGFIIVYIIYDWTSVGLNIRAIGGNQSVSRALGVNVLRTLLWVGLICGLLIGVAAIIQQSYNVKTTAMAGLTSMQLLFKPLATALLAQILQRRVNIIVAVPFCSFIIYAVFNAMTFFGIPSGTLQDVFLCVFLIVFGISGQRGVKEVVK
jgi:ribose transport system permease protein